MEGVAHYIINLNEPGYNSHIFDREEDMRNLMYMLTGRHAYNFEKHDDREGIFSMTALDINQEPIPGPTVPFNAFSEYAILGEDPLIIMAVMALFKVQRIGDILLTNFLNILEVEGTAEPFKRIGKTFFCNNPDLAQSIRSMMSYAQSNEGWSSLSVESDPESPTTHELLQGLNDFIHKWFLEVTMMSGPLSNGNIVTWFVFRKDQSIPHFNYNDDVESFILNNWNRKTVRAVLQVDNSHAYYPDYRARFALEKLTGHKVSTYNNSVYGHIYAMLEVLDKETLKYVGECADSYDYLHFSVLPTTERLTLLEALVNRYKLRNLTRTLIINPNSNLDLNSMVVLLVDNAEDATYNITNFIGSNGTSPITNITEEDILEYRQYLISNIEHCINQEDVISLKPFGDMDIDELIMISQVNGQHLYCFNYENLTALTTNPYTREPLDKDKVSYQRHLDSIYGTYRYYTIPGLVNE